MARTAIADQVLQRQDKDGMLRRALERIIQLYTDKSHFVYELFLLYLMILFPNCDYYL